ncbi:tensin-1-like [Ischnura elegans]|uniref:tensin-1-like n=1 Tax=Ischnura elegans TaxID=197161 RepID=UPI001ED8BD68|nr:tensin-1-like [Ischnura elegans]
MRPAAAEPAVDPTPPTNPRAALKVKFAAGEASGGAADSGAADGGAEGGGGGGEGAAAEGQQPDQHSLSDEDYPDLPDGSCFRRDQSLARWLSGTSPAAAGPEPGPLTPVATAWRCAQYMGSFAVAGVDQASRAEYIRNQLKQMRGPPRTKPVLLVISLAGIKVCSRDGKSVHMAHALRRISYATCDPDHFQFSFLAREPRGQLSLQYCHTFLAQSSQQAEELNSIVGNAFRMAYASQLHRRPGKPPLVTAPGTSVGSSPPASAAPVASPPSPAPPSTLTHPLPPATHPAAPGPTTLPPEKRRNQFNQEKHGGTQPDLNNDTNNNTNGGNNNSSDSLQGWSTHRWIAPGQASRPLNWVKHNPLPSSPPLEMNVQIGDAEPCDPPTSQKPPKPNSIPGLRHKGSELAAEGGDKAASSSPSSDESNSPTEMNSYKRMTEKPPLIKRLAMMGYGSKSDDSAPLVVRSNTSPTSSPVCQPAGGGSTPGKAPGPNKRRPLSGGYVNEAVNSTDGEAGTEVTARKAKTVSDNRNITSRNSKTEPKRFSQEASTALFLSKSKRIQPGIVSATLVPSSTCGGASGAPEDTCTPPPLPERSDSLNERCGEEGELRAAPWFQAGIPREITLEVLGQEPVGAFMVRESTSKPGCYALSLRVPKDFQQSGIAHYLIMRTNKGYKIKGFTKEFSSLTSLITHHSVMPELLPCPLSLSRYNPSFINSDSSRDFADIDSDPDYNTLADFRKMMADLNV